jgi:hypothetical protein
MAAPSFVNSASAAMTSGSTGPLTCNVPSGVSNGDILVGFVGNAASSGEISVTPPSGWYEIVRSSTAHVYARLASSEPASYDWYVSPGCEYAVIHHAYRPSSGSWSDWREPFAIVRWKNNGSSVVQTPALETYGTFDAMCVSFWTHGRGSVSSVVAPSGYTIAENPDTGGTTAAAVEMAAAYRSIAGNVSTASNWSVGNSGSSTTIGLAILDPGVTERTVRSFYTNTGSNGSNFALPMPYAVSGDKALAFLARHDLTDVSAPSGWALVADSVATVSSHDTISVYYREVDGTEDSSYTWSSAPSNLNWTGGIAVSAAPPALGWIASAAVDSTSDAVMDVPALTMDPVSPWVTVFAFVSPERADRTVNLPPTGYYLAWAIRNSSISTGSSSGVAFSMTSNTNLAATSFTMGNGSATSVGAHIGMGSVGGGPRFYVYILE